MKFLEVHIIQTVAPCNLNRDDTGSPKDAVFGGYRRARISSQAQKRAARIALSKFLPREDQKNLAIRTQRLIDGELIPELVKRGRSKEEARIAARNTLESLKTKNSKKKLVNEDNKTSYLFFLARQEIDSLVNLIDKNFEILQNEDKIDKKLRQEIREIFNGGKAVDLALFGRMLADRPELGVDAATQVAHALSTHKVDREFDFYTAVDDLNPEEETGAGMMGDVGFYSATLYRYALVDLEKLNENLQEDVALTISGALAFLRAFTLTLPEGKQNSFAAHNPPLFVAVRAGEGLPRNLATAFEKPIWPRETKSIAGLSVEALLQEWEKFDKAYGNLESEWIGLLNLSDGELVYHSDKLKEDYDDLLRGAEEATKILLQRGKEA